MSEDYLLSWVKSSVRIHNVGLYDNILDCYPLTGKNVLELGVGPGLETEKIWLKGPETFLGIDKKSRMLSLSERYLKSQGYPVNAKYINLPSFADRITGKNVLNDPDFDIKKDAINLALADYNDFTTFDASLSESFDFAFLTFVGGDDGSTAQNVYAVLDALGTADFLLKPGGTFVYAERVFCENPEDIKKRITAPVGYRLNFFEFDENQKYVEATLYGNKSIDMAVNGVSHELTADDSAADGALVKNMCDVFREELGCKAGILRMEFVKE